MVAIHQILVDASIFARLIKNQHFDKNDYSLGERTNQDSEIVALIGQYSTILWILRALVFRSTLVASSTLVT